MKNESSPGRRSTPGKSDKVGSAPDAARKIGGEGDFGIPAAEAKVDPGGRPKGPEQGTGQTRSSTRTVRTSGVGAPIGPAGAGSGGDIDPDIIGLDGRGGVAADPGERRTSGPDISEGGSAPFASGPPAKGQEPAISRAKPGPRPPLDTVDHSGGDITTTGDESSEATNPEIEEIAQESDLDV